MDVVSPRQLSCVTAIHDGNDINCVLNKSKTRAALHTCTSRPGIMWTHEQHVANMH